MQLPGTASSAWVLMDLMKVFFCAFSVMTHFNKYDIFHQQASFHLSMSSAVMSEAESTPPPPPLALPSPSSADLLLSRLSSLINTHGRSRCSAPFHPRFPPLPCVDLSNLARLHTFGLIQQSQMPARCSSLGSRSSAPVRSHSHLAHPPSHLGNGTVGRFRLRRPS